MTKQEIEKWFPGLAKSDYDITSRATADYNCIAWAAGNVNKWWEPSPDYYWPPSVPYEYTLDAYIKAYEILGYNVCHDDKYENGFEKIAIYNDSYGMPTHAARQLSSGKWTSKLGEAEDIEHTALDGLVSLVYGSVAVILKRPFT